MNTLDEATPHVDRTRTTIIIIPGRQLRLKLFQSPRVAIMRRALPRVATMRHLLE
jgi:hypothetical protein